MLKSIRSLEGVPPPQVGEPRAYLGLAVRERLELLGARLGLGDAEHAVLAALVAVSIAPDAGVVVQMLQQEAAGSGVRAHALARWLGGDGALDAALVGALAPDAPLQRWLLIERTDAALVPLAFERWVASRAVVGYAVGAPSLSPEVTRGGARLRSAADGELEPDDDEAVAAAIARGGSLRLVGRDTADLTVCATGAVLRRLPRALVAQSTPTRAMVRDALLAQAALVVELDASDPTLRDALELAASGRVPAILVTSQAAPGVAEVERAVAPPSPPARRALWETALARRGVTAPAQVLEEAGDAFAIGRGPVERAAARLVPALAGAPATALDLGAALAAELPDAAGALGDFEPLVREIDWGALHAPDETLLELRQLVDRCRHRRRVLDDMRLGRLAGSRGVVSLFYGPPGTGKTMATRLVAASMGWRLLRIDSSRLVSKWIGETEKNLARVLDAAEDGRFALLFDEADALFGKRSTENRGGSDRYANLEINYLLQRLEHFDGVVFLTSNLEQSVDPAFRRRLAARIEFPMPDAATRAKLWRSMVPAQVELDASLADRLAYPELAGGNIKNAVLRAAFLAAGEGRDLQPDDLRAGLALELRALGKLGQDSLEP